jgi:lipoate-protein ligase A
MFRVVRWQGRNIFDVLKLEEALFRDTDKNWVVIGKGTPRSIVMGPTGVANQLLNTEMAVRDQIPVCISLMPQVIRRFTGGGTVIVDEQTVFVSLIGGIDWITQKAFANNFQFFPRPLLEWSSSFYQPGDLANPFSLFSKLGFGVIFSVTVHPSYISLKLFSCG